jgi:uncharacterized membrane protein YraQ (UPF0718 family)
MTRTSRLVNEVPAVVVFGVILVGMLAIWQGYWRKGLFVVATASLLGAALRLVLPTRRAGSLAVRGRAFDVAFLAVVGAFTLVLAAVTEGPPG